MISFIIPAKNTSKYIEDAIVAVRRQNQVLDWELIVVDDHSTDGTCDIVRKIAEEDPRVTIVKNAGKGKVQALNHGFALSRGEFIKCIDADDVMDPEFFVEFAVRDFEEAHMHDAFIVDADMNRLGVYHMQSAITQKKYKEILDELVSIPRWSWTINRELALKIFPMPEDLPFEDVWFTMIIKKNASHIQHCNKGLYHYRQHDEQTFGGILNYGKDILNFRAKRMLDLISKFKNNSGRLGLDSPELLKNAKTYYSLLQDDFEIRKILGSPLRFSQKIKLILICFFPTLARGITRVKWKLDRIKSLR